MCDGQLLPISQYSALFSLFGTIYGGDGRTTFGLPDLRGRSAIHQGHGPGLSDRRIGAKGGSEYNILNVTQLPSHNHVALMKTADTPLSDSPVNNYPSQAVGRVSGSGAPTPVQISAWGTTAGSDHLASDAITVGNTGGNQSVNNMQPWLCITYCVALQGIFPSRN